MGQFVIEILHGGVFVELRELALINGQVFIWFVFLGRSKLNYQTLVSAEQLYRHINDEQWLIVDCRFDLSDVDKGQSLYQQSHIPGALYAHLDRQLSSPINSQSGRHPMPDMQQLLSWLRQIGMHSSKQVVVYDDSFGAMASRLWWLLKCLGHDAVALLDGGWQAWNEASYEVNDQQPRVEPDNYQASFDWQQVVSTERVMGNLQNREFALIDVRTSERFNGIAEPIDPVAGHIPAAFNIPLAENLDAQGKYKSPQQLRELYAEVIEQYPSVQQVYMCGSGVTACHSLIALCVAGYQMPRVYAGSWSEWIRDKSRPIITRQD